MIRRILRLTAGLVIGAACLGVMTRWAWLWREGSPTSPGALDSLGLGSIIAAATFLLSKFMHSILRKYLESTRIEYRVAGADIQSDFFEWESVGSIEYPMHGKRSKGVGVRSSQSREDRDFLWVETLPDLDAVGQAST